MLTRCLFALQAWSSLKIGWFIKKDKQILPGEKCSCEVRYLTVIHAHMTYENSCQSCQVSALTFSSLLQHHLLGAGAGLRPQWNTSINHHKYPAPTPKNKSQAKHWKQNLQESTWPIHWLVKNIPTCTNFMDA